jgi:Flp pilus assembly protein TadB
MQKTAPPYQMTQREGLLSCFPDRFETGRLVDCQSQSGCLYCYYSYLVLKFEYVVTNTIQPTPNDSLRDKARNLRGNKKKHPIYKKLIRMKTALAVTGKSKQFTLVCCASLVLFAGGAILSILIDNLFLLPVLSIAFALLPFFYITSTLSHYEKHTKEELETTLSIISTSYIRSDDIVSAVSENIKYIKPPLREVFQAFVGDAVAISSNTKRAIMNLKDKVDDDIFAEWCHTLIQCQDDRTLKDTLLPIVAKLTDVRIVNSELKTMFSSVRNEYWMMVALVAGNIPLLYFLNRDWFETLMFTTPGKIVLGICGAVILITALFMMKFTKPIAYRR